MGEDEKLLHPHACIVPSDNPRCELEALEQSQFPAKPDLDGTSPPASICA
jgi:hypothetical protein